MLPYSTACHGSDFFWIKLKFNFPEALSDLVSINLYLVYHLHTLGECSFQITGMELFIGFSFVPSTLSLLFFLLFKLAIDLACFQSFQRTCS